MKYHVTKFIKLLGEILTLLRVIFCERSFIICYNSKIGLNEIETDRLCIIASSVINKHTKELAKPGKTADILYNPYRYPCETDKAYFARIRAGMLK